MKLFVVLLCSILVAQGLRIFKKELRSLHQVEKNKIIAKTIIGDFNGIYQEIHNAAKQGKNETRIDLRCSYTLGINGECKPNRNNDLLYQMDHVQSEFPYKFYSYILLRKINQTFPDTRVTQIKKPCCAYLLAW